MPKATSAVLCEVAAERERQHLKFGQQDHPDGTGCYAVAEGGDIRHDRSLGAVRRDRAEEAKRACDAAAQEDRLTYRHILEEEWHEARAEDDRGRLRAELVQVAAVAVAWIEKLDREAKPFGMVQPLEPWPRS